MKRTLIIALALLTTSAGMAVAAGGGGVKPAQSGVAGKFSLLMMVHTNSSSFGDLPGVNPWDGSLTEGTVFAYRSIPCTGNAPVNNISTDLSTYNARVKGSRVPASMRAHPFAFRLVKKKRGGYFMQGYMELVACKLGPGPTASPDPVPDADKPRIRLRFLVKPRIVNDETVSFNGTFKLRGGTQRYEDLTGEGTMSGYFLCFAPEGCKAKGGKYLDAQMSLQGSYADPTPQLDG